MLFFFVTLFLSLNFVLIGAYIMKKGFTLIELLVVVLIIGILSSIALPQYRVAVEKARIAEAMSMIGSLRSAIDVYVLANNEVDTVEFIGAGGGYGDSQVLDVDAESVLNCSGSNDDRCQGKYFSYDAYCNSATACYINACRGTEDVCYDGVEDYRIGASRNSNGWSNFCDSYSSFGDKICKPFAAQGWNVSLSDE